MYLVSYKQWLIRRFNEMVTRYLMIFHFSPIRFLVAAAVWDKFWGEERKNWRNRGKFQLWGLKRKETDTERTVSKLGSLPEDEDYDDEGTSCLSPLLICLACCYLLWCLIIYLLNQLPFLLPACAARQIKQLTGKQTNKQIEGTKPKHPSGVSHRGENLVK